jgi:hypothetical protein
MGTGNWVSFWFFPAEGLPAALPSRSSPGTPIVKHGWEELQSAHRRTMKTHRFSLVLSGVSELTPELGDSLYEAIGGSIEFNMRNGVAFLEVERTAPSLRAAIVSTIGEVEEAQAGIRVVRVESETANVIAKINAELLGATAHESD